jgi:chromosome partitioning protein
MAHVIAVANQKGGCGKTTVSVNVAACLSREGYKVLLVDADPQASAMKWRMNREENGLPFLIRTHPYPTLHKELPNWPEHETYDVILIDCPPGGQGSTGRTDNVTRSAIMACHIVLIPVRPSPLDYQASEEIMPLLSEIHVMREDLRAFLVVNCKPPSRTRIASDAKDAARTMFTTEDFSVGVLETELHTRTAYIEAPAAGKAVVDYDPTSKAAEEIHSLTQEILQCLMPASVPASAV